MVTIGQILEEAITSSFIQVNGDGSFKLEVKSRSSDRYKTVTSGPGRIITNIPEKISLGDISTESGANHQLDESWVTTYRSIRLGEIGSGFVAYTTNRHSTGCQYAGGEYVVTIAGEMPILEFGTAYADWAKVLEDEAYEYLCGISKQRNAKIRHSLAFAAGFAHRYAPHDLRRSAWRSVLRRLGIHHHRDLSKISYSVRTATAKAALRLGWKPSVAVPAYWNGYPNGVVEIAL